MTITTTSDKTFDVEILQETIRGKFANKDAFMGSPIAARGGVMVSSSMPHGNESFIGNTIVVPYFGTIGPFINNPDGSAVTPAALKGTNETGTIDRDSLAFEVSHWAQHSGPEDRDPYEEASDQIMVSATRQMDDVIITAAKATPLIHDVYDAATPQLLDIDVMADAEAKWRDENENIVGAIVHSRTMNDLRKLRDENGRPLLHEATDGSVPMFMGKALFQSDKAPLDGSTMGSVVSDGTSPPVATLAGTPLGAWNLVIELQSGTAHGAATIRFSTDGGNTWSADLTTAGVGVALPLIDTATDSLVGYNGKTGVTVAFAAGTFNADQSWVASAQLKVRTLLVKRGALAFWYNSAAMELLTDKNILAHTDIAAMHLYRVAHLYRRVAGGTLPGVVSIAHNVSGY